MQAPYVDGVNKKGGKWLLSLVKRKTATRYVKNIRYNHVMPYVRFVGFERFVLMHHHACPPTVYTIEQNFREVDIGKKNWPATSPDLNLIEFALDMLKTSIERRSSPPRSL